MGTAHCSMAWNLFDHVVLYYRIASVLVSTLKLIVSTNRSLRMNGIGRVLEYYAELPCPSVPGSVATVLFICYNHRWF